ncbi:MAG: hypothetical protein P9M00_13635, partial [Candidatus Tritonobacter lacicola]|nr:hypothetical protein [Candidatus Tritonobacter lacicola]
PDMRLEKDDGQTYVSPTHILTYTITFWNDGNIVTDPSTQIVDTIPADTTYVAGGTSCSLAATIEYSVGGAPYSATEPPTGTANVTIRWSMPAGVPATSGPYTATFQVQVDDGLDNGDTVTNEATISDGGTHGVDPTPWNNTDDDVDQVQVPELSILKDDGVTLVEAGETLTYVLTYANNGDANAPNTVIEDAIPAGTTYVAGGTSIIDPTAQIWYSVGGAPYDTTEPATGTADVTIQFRIPNLVASDGGTAQFQVRVDTPLTVSTIINTSTIDYDGSNGSDPKPWNNSDTDTDYGKLPLFVMKRCAGEVTGYDTPNPGDWTYWDAEARNPSGLAGDWWVIPDDPWVIRKMTEVDSGDGGSQEFAILKLEGGDFSDYNIYLYNVPVIGDLTYWDAMARNPSPLARDLWQIPGGNDTALLADGGNDHMLSMKDEVGDFNIYLYNSLHPGDWSYWDAVARNPSPLARDLWVISDGNDIVAMCGLDTTGDKDSDSLLVLKDEWGDYNLYLWNMPATGDWTYWDAVARNPSPLARDLWMIPSSNDLLLITGINRGSTFDELGVFVDVGGDHDLYKWNDGGDQNFYLWNAPRPGDWTYWNAAARNPSPLARDLWIIPSNNNIFAISAPRLGAAPPTPTP